jgi:site-specific DNA-adenine methylase
MKILSIIAYLGGKYNLVKETVPLIEWCADKYNLKGYLEICGGGCRQLLNISLSKFEYRLYNDIDLGLCKLFKCLGSRALTYEMINKLLKIEYTEENFNTAKELYDQDDTDIVTAAAYTFLLALQSRAGDMKTFEKKYLEINKETEESKYYSRVQKLHSLHVILSGVDIKNKDALDILDENLDRGDYFITIDPPYVDSSKKSKMKTYKNDDFNHERMVDLLLKTKSKVMLCGYDKKHNFYDRLNELNGWHKIFVKDVFVASSAKVGTRADEYIWVNFIIPNHILRYDNCIR